MSWREGPVQQVSSRLDEGKKAHGMLIPPLIRCPRRVYPQSWQSHWVPSLRRIRDDIDGESAVSHPEQRRGEPCTCLLKTALNLCTNSTRICRMTIVSKRLFELRTAPYRLGSAGSDGHHLLPFAISDLTTANLKYALLAIMGGGILLHRE